MVVTRTNEQWLKDLRSTGEAREAALADLYQILQKGLPQALNRWLSPSDARFNALVEETAQITLLRVLEKLDTFEKRSQFTTWVYKIAVRIALTELRRKRWENLSLEEMVESDSVSFTENLMMDHRSVTPEAIVERAEIMQRIQQMIAEELTPKQRQVMMAIAIKGVPIEEVARRMGTNRNALYKMMHDTRLRLKHRLLQEGISIEDILASFESGKINLT